MVKESGLVTYKLNFWAVSGMICLNVRDSLDILRKEAQRRSWAEIYNGIWEIPVKENQLTMM